MRVSDAVSVGGDLMSDSESENRVMLENANHPGQVRSADGRMYRAMRAAMLQVLPDKAPGLTQIEIQRDVIAHLPSELFPGGAKSGWWSKAVQLDLEAKGLVVREPSRPLRWHRRPDPPA